MRECPWHHTVEEFDRLTLNRTVKYLRERALAAEALVRAKDETIGELLDLYYHDVNYGYWYDFDEWLRS